LKERRQHALEFRRPTGQFRTLQSLARRGAGARGFGGALNPLPIT